MWKWLTSIRGLLFVGSLTICLIPLGLVIAWVTQNAINNQFDAVREKHLIVAKNLSTALSRYARDASSVFALFSQLSMEELTSAAVVGVAESYHYRVFMALDADDNVIKSAAFDGSLANAHFDEELVSKLRREASKTRGKISFTGVKAYENKPHLWMVRLTNNHELHLGLLRTDYLIKTQKAIQFGERGHSMIVDQFGRVIAHPNAQWEQTSKDASKLSVVQKMMSGETGVSEFYSPPMQADMIAGHTSVPETGWGIMVPQPVQELYDAAQGFQKIAFAIAFAGFLIAIALSGWLSSLIGGGVLRLSSASKSLIKNGNLSMRVAEPRTRIPSELHTLTMTYNQMLQQLEQQSAALREALNISEAANRTKTEFLANITHELRTPMNGVIGSLEIIKGSADIKHVGEYANMALRSSAHLVELINDVLFYSSLEAGKIKIEKAPFDLRSLVEQVCGSLQIEAERKGIKLILSAATDLPPFVEGDETGLKQVLINVVGNAVKFTESGQVEVRSYVSNSNVSESALVIDVIDTGPGISSEKMPSIFDRFFQIDSSLKRKKGGTGLGLSISRDLVHLMGGEISVQSNLGIGSTFTVIIPFKSEKAAA